MPKHPSASVLSRGLILHARNKAAASTVREEDLDSFVIGYLEGEIEGMFDVIFHSKSSDAELYLETLKKRLTADHRANRPNPA